MAGEIARKPRELEPITMQGVRIIFRNFSGAESQYNREGDRNFGVLLPPDVAQRIREEGWNVKTLRVREEGDEPQDWLPVAVSYKNRPPMVNLVTRKGRNPIGEDMISLIDWVDIADVDMVVAPYSWVANGNSGVKAYLRKIFVIVQEDALDQKYENVPVLGNEEMAAIEYQDPNIVDAEIVDGEDEL